MANAYSSVATNVPAGYAALAGAVRDVYALDIEHTAMGIMRYEEAFVVKPQLGATPGQTVVFTTYDDIGGGGQIAEHVEIEAQSMSNSTKQISVAEWANAVGVSEKLLLLSWDDVLQEAATQLGRNYAKVRDLYLRDTLVTGGSQVFTTPGAAALGDVLANDTFDVETVRRVVEMFQTANAPKFEDDYYLCYLHPHQLAYLRRDPDWIAAQNYANTRRLFNGEAGRWEDTVFIQTTFQQNGAVGVDHGAYDADLVTAGDANQNLYRATFVADQAAGVADALPVEMRDDGVRDFGRKHRLAWYAIFGAGVLKDDHIIHAISS